MFTGIIEDIGTIQSIKKNTKSQTMTISSKILEDVKLGDSIATNGLCLTVTKLTPNTFDVDVMVESMNRSNFGDLRIGSPVNLEKAMRMGDRFGGHMVSGHIDGVGIIKSHKKEENATWITIEVPQSLRKYMTMKGSISIDGISLTIANITSEGVQVSIIPHTKDQTTLLSKKVGDKVNLEMDMMVKYVETLIKHDDKTLDEETLKHYGYK
ncbi:MAG: riboflavin synthase [Acholeplasmataceae bacterium]